MGGGGVFDFSFGFIIFDPWKKIFRGSDEQHIYKSELIEFCMKVVIFIKNARRPAKNGGLRSNLFVWAFLQRDQAGAMELKLLALCG